MTDMTNGHKADPDDPKKTIKVVYASFAVCMEREANTHAAPQALPSDRKVFTRGGPAVAAPVSEDRLTRIVVGALRECVQVHGDKVEGSWIGSAAKRIVHQITAEG